MSLFYKRQGQMDCDEIYFYTGTIYKFYPLLQDDELKLIIIDSLRYLVTNQLAVVYGFVVMPNHIHIIWKTLQDSRNETIVGSFTKFTGHQFKKYLQHNHSDQLNIYWSSLNDRNYQFWKGDPLAIYLSNLTILEQKLDYIHQNPVKEKWSLADFPENYKWSSARFYQDGFDEFGFLTHYMD